MMERIKVAGGELRGRASGGGQPVLCVHGSISADTFECLRDQPALAGFELIAYRRRGFVDSVGHDGPFSIEQQADDAIAVLQHFGHRQAHVVGHSYGGLISLQLALNAAQCVHSLALLEPPLMIVPPPEEFEAEFGSAVAAYETGDKRGAVAGFIRAVAGPDYEVFLERSLGAGWMDQAVADIDTFFQVEAPALEAWSFGEAEARRITLPCLAVVGGKSGPADEHIAGWLSTTLPDVETFRLPEATHLLQMMNPSAMASGLAAFLAGHAMT
jgi:pimeloyl-ACP methyl ester carboxylesterase